MIILNTYLDEDITKLSKHLSLMSSTSWGFVAHLFYDLILLPSGVCSKEKKDNRYFFMIHWTCRDSEESINISCVLLPCLALSDRFDRSAETFKDLWTVASITTLFFFCKIIIMENWNHPRRRYKYDHLTTSMWSSFQQGKKYINCWNTIHIHYH